MKQTEPKKPRNFYAKAVTRKSGAGAHEPKKHTRKEKHPVKSFKQFHEEGPAAVNAVGGGNVQGIGFGPKGEPGGTKAIMNKMLKRKSPNVAVKLPT